MLVSIITDVLNAEDTIEEAICSLLRQTYKNVEYIIIDGKSDDRTIGIIDKYRGNISKFVSEPDNNHFEAMNKGLKFAIGDIVGFLHADDFFATDEALEKIVEMFKEKKVDCLWGDLVYVDGKNKEKIIRYWKSCGYQDSLFKNGWMPPHPSFFVKRHIYEKYGYFNTNLPISADYEIMLRFLYKYRISSCYLPEVLVGMRAGGLSNRNLKNIIQKSREDYMSWKANRLNIGIQTILLKNIIKIPQFFVR